MQIGPRRPTLSRGSALLARHVRLGPFFGVIGVEALFEEGALFAHVGESDVGVGIHAVGADVEVA